MVGWKNQTAYRYPRRLSPMLRHVRDRRGFPARNSSPVSRCPADGHGSSAEGVVGRSPPPAELPSIFVLPLLTEAGGELTAAEAGLSSRRRSSRSTAPHEQTSTFSHQTHLRLRPPSVTEVNLLPPIGNVRSHCATFFSEREYPLGKGLGGTGLLHRRGRHLPRCPLGEPRSTNSRGGPTASAVSFCERCARRV